MKTISILFTAGAFFVLGCKGRPANKTAPGSKKQEKIQKKEVKTLNTQKKIVATPQKTAKTVKPVETKTQKTPADILSKKNLEKCYLEVYCAQKNGSMAKLLDIYKKYGFDTPKKWTKAYINAAKDTDWVSELARKASKACKKKK